MARSEGGIGGSTLIAPGRGRAFEQGRFGPALHVGIRAAATLSRRWRLVFDAGWRGSFLGETDFAKDTRQTKPLHIFPVTVGVRFEP